jgi:predicted CXXCH cytochrome family protein
LKILLTVKSGTRASVRKTITGEWLRVGRNAACEIHLPDPRVPLDQGMVVGRDGLVYIEGEAGSQNITRKTVRSMRLEPGHPIDVGPYRMEAQVPPAGYDGALMVELVRPLEASAGLESRNLTLASLGFTKRLSAWALGLLVLFLFLMIPAGRVLDMPWRDAATYSAFGDKFWNPGPLILAHQPIEPRCAACHEVAFQHVKDRACLQCHTTIGHHVGAEMKPAELFGGARCATCHREHKGVKAVHRDDDQLCVDCHRDIKARVPGATTGKASDFARDHPAFQVKPVASNLAFPHAVHLDPAGVRSPLQGRMKLDCKSCHQPDATRRTFQAISMPKHCQECHTLQFEPAVTTREVPHGKPADAVIVVEEFYANIALKGLPDSFVKAFGIPGEGLLRRVGDPTPAERQSALALASRKAKQVSGELFEVRVCKTCHEVGKDWTIAPVRANNNWMPHARFDHKAHQQVSCVDCHDVTQSKKSTDVAMPTIAKCRDCHGGSKPVEGKVTSNCMLCHGFHVPGNTWDPTFVPQARRTGGIR